MADVLPMKQGTTGLTEFGSGDTVPVANGGTGATDATTARSNLGLVIGTNVQAHSANLDEYAAVNPTSAGLALLDDADAWAQRETLGLNLIRAQQDLQLANLTTGLVDFLNAFADGFNNTAGVDSGNSTNYSVTSGYAAPSTNPSYTSVASVSPNTDFSPGMHTFRTVIAAAQLTDVSASQVRVKFAAPSGGNCVIAGAYIGVKSGTYGFASTPTQLLFGGAAGTTLTAGSGNSYSDAVTFAYDGTSDLVVAVNYTSGSVRYLNTTSTGWTLYFKASVADASTTSPSGYTLDAADATYIVAGIDTVATTTNNMDLRSTSRAVTLSPPTVADVYALVEETDALTPNTDIILYASRDGNTSYVTGTASELGTLANGLVLYAATGISLTGQGSASNLRWKVTTANNKNCKVHAIGVYAR